MFSTNNVWKYEPAVVYITKRYTDVSGVVDETVTRYNSVKMNITIKGRISRLNVKMHKLYRLRVKLKDRRKK